MAEVELLLVDGDATARSWVRLSLRGSEFRVTAEASSAAEALALIDVAQPDFLLVDFDLPDHRGTELVRELRRRWMTARAVVMTADSVRGFNEMAHEAGAQGSLLKTGDPTELLDALRIVATGREAFDPRHPRRDTERHSLSLREREALNLTGEGLGTRAIAKRLDLSEATVKALLGRAYSRLRWHPNGG